MEVYFISIPSGAIKSFTFKERFYFILQISIPSGAIKSI